MGTLVDKPFHFLRTEYPEVASHFEHRDAVACVQSLFQADREKGSVLFHLFQKLIARPDVLTHKPVRAIAERAHTVLNAKPLAKGPASQLDGANVHFGNLLRAEKVGALNSMEAIADRLRTLYADIFVPGVDLLTAQYAEFDPKILHEIEQLLKDSGGAISDPVRAECIRLSYAVTALDLSDTDLSTGAFLAGLVDLGTTFSQLRKLNLTNCKLNAEIMKAVEHALPQLQELDVSKNACDLFAGNETRENAFQSLRALSWNDSQENAHWCSHLPKIPTLEHFSFQGAKVTQPDVLATLSQRLPNLKTLDLSRNNYDLNMHRLQFVAEFRVLKKLIIRDCHLVTKEDVATLRAIFPQIEIII